MFADGTLPRLACNKASRQVYISTMAHVSPRALANDDEMMLQTNAEMPRRDMAAWLSITFLASANACRTCDSACMNM